MANMVGYKSNVVSDGGNGFSQECATYNYYANLSANVEDNFTVPNESAEGGSIFNSKNSYVAIITYQASPTVSAFYCVNSTATAPSGAFNLVDVMQITPYQQRTLYLKAGDVFSIISRAAASVTVSLYAR